MKKYFLKISTEGMSMREKNPPTYAFDGNVIYIT